MKFAGHERDLGDTSSAADDLDYMMARFCNPQTGRFLSTDSADVLSLQFGDEEDVRRFREYLGTPQSWNRYAYVRDSPLRYIDPNGRDPLAAVATTTWFIGEGGAGATVGGAGIAAGAGAGAAVLGAGAVGYGVGTLIRQIPGVDRGLQTAIGGVVDFIFTAQNNRHREKVITGLIAGAQKNLNNIASAGGPGRDPDFNHHKKEIKAILERAAKLAKRLPAKTASKLLDKIRDIADKVDLRLEE
jgi:RHS repeat-associated protein